MKVNGSLLKCKVYTSVLKCDEVYAVLMVWKCVKVYESERKCIEE
jgi:hypothetical protein